MKLVVTLNEQDKETGPQTYRRYLTAICYQPYRYGDSCRATSDELEAAFVFTERAAAEVAAVWIGGSVEEIDR